MYRHNYITFFGKVVVKNKKLYITEKYIIIIYVQICNYAGRFVMNIIIVGCGKVGTTLVEQLDSEGNNITIIDKDSKTVSEISGQNDVMGIVGNGASYQVQVEAGVKNADLLIAVTESDEVNILCCLIAKKAGDCHTIARIRNYEYSQQIRMIKEELGLAMVINPEIATAQEISRVLRMPSAIKVDTFVKGKVELLKFKIPEDSVLHNVSVMDITTKLKCDVLVCLIERGDEVFIPRGNFVLKEKDVVSFVASPKKAMKFFIKTGIISHRIKDVMLVGGGATAFYLTKVLDKIGMSVKIIEKDKARCEHLSDILPEATIIHGDGTERTVLLEEGLEKTDAFIALTGHDEQNVLLSMYAKTVNECKVVTKIKRMNFDEVIKNLDLDTTVYPKNLTADYIMRYVRAMKNADGSNLETMYSLIEDKVEALEYKIGRENQAVGVPLEQLKIKEGILLAAISRNGEIITPRGKDMLKIGDSVIIVSMVPGIEDITDIVE